MHPLNSQAYMHSHSYGGTISLGKGEGWLVQPAAP